MQVANDMPSATRRGKSPTQPPLPWFRATCDHIRFALYYLGLDWCSGLSRHQVLRGALLRYSLGAHDEYGRRLGAAELWGRCRHR